MRTEVIHYIVQVYRHRSISKVAAQNNISPQGLSKAIRSVEHELSVKLFYKDSSGATPTKVCEHIYPFFLKILQAEKNIAISSELYQQENENILSMIGRESGLAIQINRIIEKINRQGNFKIIFQRYAESESTLENMFKSGNSDMYFCTRELLPYKDKNKRGDVICNIPIAFVADESNPLSSCSQIEISQFRDYSFLSEHLDSPHISFLKQLCEAEGFSPTIISISDRLLIWEMLKDKPSYIHVCKQSDLEKAWRIGFNNIKQLDVIKDMNMTVILRSRSVHAPAEIIKQLRDGLKDYR